MVDSLAVKYSEFSTTESSMVAIDAVAEVAPGGNVTVIAVDEKSDPPVQRNLYNFLCRFIHIREADPEVGVTVTTVLPLTAPLLNSLNMAFAPSPTV